MSAGERFYSHILIYPLHRTKMITGAVMYVLVSKTINHDNNE